MRVLPRRASGQRDPADAAPRRPRPRKKPRRWLWRFGSAALVALGLLLVSTAVNAAMERAEKSSTPAYGERVPVEGGALNVWRSGGEGQPIVLLSGLGTAAPGLDFAPLARELDGFNVIVVEGFGYGYSDMEGPPRTNENISTELHAVLARLQVRQPYVLAGHSIAGFYMLDYANRYRSEISAVVGIDATIPKPGDGQVPEPESGFSLERALAVTGIVRAVTFLAPGLLDPDGGAYTEDELHRMRLMANWNFGNPAVADETARIANNAGALRGVTYPDDLPVLAFIADESDDSTATKVSSAENLLDNVSRHQVVTIEGGHYLHHTQSARMAEEIRAFLAIGEG